MHTDLGGLDEAPASKGEAALTATAWLDRLKARAPAWFRRWMCWDMPTEELQALKDDMRIW